MIVSNILKKIFKRVHDKYSLLIPDFHEDVKQGLYGDFDGILSELSNNATYNSIPILPDLLQILGDNQFNPGFIESNYNNYRKISFINLNKGDFRKRDRPFFYFDDEYAYISLGYFFNNCLPPNTLSNEVKEVMQHVLLSSAVNSNNEIDTLFDHLVNQRKDIGILLLKSGNRKSEISNYSFVYFKYLRKGYPIKIDSRLKVSRRTKDLIFHSENKYAQFFELFDVMNEINLAPDLITRFLRMYHILEFLTYRVKIVSIEEKARERKTFLREIYTINNSGDKEEGQLKACFKTIFSSDISTIKNHVKFSRSNKNFIEKHFGIKATSFNEDNYIPRTIYKVRNAIVHNKESEFHILISNPKEYSEIIGMIKRLTEVMEDVIAERVNQPHPSIDYKSAAINLF